MSAIDQPRYVLLGLWQIVWFMATCVAFFWWYIVFGVVPWLLFVLAAVGGDEDKRHWIARQSGGIGSDDDVFVGWTIWAVINTTAWCLFACWWFGYLIW